ncbi:hypothetical protein SpCBS45565_g07589 [Spizellomyces sp. 'palustris']|nr:hypothetical protein SpCBS45565_g07589 [Spizellomyces sp. 'palustris']
MTTDPSTPDVQPTLSLLTCLSTLSPSAPCAQELSTHISQGADLAYRDPNNNGASPLHVAAFRGNLEAITTLFRAGAQWNTIDDNGKSVGEYAYDGGFQDVYEHLVEEGVRTEFLLMALGAGGLHPDDEVEEKHEQDDSVTSVKPASAHPSNANYLARRLTYSEGRLLDSDNNAVMMGWEAPLMELHADVIAPEPGLHVLNVGFGLGLVDEYLQKRSPATHTIIEAHPDVYAKMIADGWDKRPGVRILFGRWQDVLDQLQAYDGIFFDTFGEYYDDLKEFHEHVPNILSQTGVYSFFNGLAGTNPFFHDVSCRLAEADLREMGLMTEYREYKMDELGDEVWQGVKRPYWSLPVYRLPVVTF